MGTGDAWPIGGKPEHESAVAGRASAVEPAARGGDESPVGRLAEVGTATLSVGELLAVLLRARGAWDAPWRFPRS